MIDYMIDYMIEYMIDCMIDYMKDYIIDYTVSKIDCLIYILRLSYMCMTQLVIKYGSFVDPQRASSQVQLVRVL